MEFIRIAEEEELCKACLEAGIVSVEQFRIRRRALKISEVLLDEEGHLDLKQLESVERNYDLPSYTLFDHLFAAHVKNVCRIFRGEGKAKLRFRQLSLPLANPLVENFVRYTLLKGLGDPLTKRDLSLALLSSILSFLRQSVGSCFATAPLILVQREDPLFLLEELYNFMTRGFVRRMIEGVEYKIPMSIKTGKGDLTTPLGEKGYLDPSVQFVLGSLAPKRSYHSVEALLREFFQGEELVAKQELFKAHTQSPLLKSYEYTIASFADVKVEFYKWNMYAGLGLDAKVEGGIGQTVFRYLEEALEKANKEIESASDQLGDLEREWKVQESLLRSSHTEERIRRAKRNLQFKEHEMEHLFVSREEKGEEGKVLSGFFPFFIEQLLRLFPQYFQEVYDPEMTIERGFLLEDAPSGFRLLYKHGKQDATKWSMITNEEEYQWALQDFFQLIEKDLEIVLPSEKGKKILREVLDIAIQFVRSPEFIEGASKRTSALHQEHIGGRDLKTAWCYLSGGNVDSFLKGYMPEVKEFKKWEFSPKTPLDLLLTLVEYLKDLPLKEVENFEKGALKGLLFTSPTHAFVLLPTLSPFWDFWQETSANTYTSIRDEYIGKILDWYKRNPLQNFSTLPVPPLIFADTNWRNDFFSLFPDPVTKEIALWRFEEGRLISIPSWSTQFGEGKRWAIYKNFLPCSIIR